MDSDDGEYEVNDGQSEVSEEEENGENGEDDEDVLEPGADEIGRASCRERVWR